MALESFGKDLNHNALWQALSSEERATYVALLDPTRFYDAKTHTLIDLPENYFGVAARMEGFAAILPQSATCAEHFRGAQQDTIC
jgi:hypothetical protein